MRTLEHMCALPENPPIVVVDNASTDGTASLMAQRFPEVALISLECNIGAAARNIGVRHAHTPYVAFADDDSWWAPGSLSQAAGILDAHPGVAVLCARVLLNAEEREDPMCAAMAASPLPAEGLPGSALLGFIACAAVFRRQAYLDVGGYEEKFFIGGEEELLTLDLTSAGWRVVYAPQLTVHHYPSTRRDNAARRKIVVRNALWVAWLRLPLLSAIRQSRRVCKAAPTQRAMWSGLAEALGELPWIMRRRRVLPADVHAMYRKVHA